MTAHDIHWTEVRDDAEKRLVELFDGDGFHIGCILGHDRGIETAHDVKRLLAYTLGHGDCHERACAIMNAGSWMQAHNELAESKPVTGVPAV